MKGSMSTDLGIITVNPEVIAKYAGSVAVECFGIVGMAAVNMKDGLVRLLKKDSLTHGIQVTISDNNEITLNFHVIVAYGVNILSVSDNLMSNVKYKVEEFTGMAVEKINIFVEGVRVIDYGGYFRGSENDKYRAVPQDVSCRCGQSGSKKRIYK